MADKAKSEKKQAKAAGGAAKTEKQAAKADKKQAKGGGSKSAGVAVTEGRPQAPKLRPRLATYYESEVRPALMAKFKYKSAMEAPRILKIVLNMGVGDAISDAKLLDSAVNEMTMIAGQRPSVRRAKKSISNFKLREGVPNGCAVTLRGARMYEFYDRFINVAIPRIRDFRGVNPRSFDGRGNYSVGVTEQIIFPEIDYDKVAKVRGLDVTIVTSAKNDEEGRELLKLMNMPFRQR